MSNVTRFDEFRIDFGNDPVRLFPCKSRCTTTDRFKQEVTIPKANYEKGLSFQMNLVHMEVDLRKSCY